MGEEHVQLSGEAGWVCTYFVPSFFPVVTVLLGDCCGEGRLKGLRVMCIWTGRMVNRMVGLRDWFERFEVKWIYGCSWVMYLVDGKASTALYGAERLAKVWATSIQIVFV